MLSDSRGAAPCNLRETCGRVPDRVMLTSLLRDMACSCLSRDATVVTCRVLPGLALAWRS